MLTEHHTPAWSLLRECEQLAHARFGVPVAIWVGILPALDGDFWSAEVRSESDPARRSPPLIPPCNARGKVAALQALRDQLRSSEPLAPLH